MCDVLNINCLKWKISIHILETLQAQFICGFSSVVSVEFIIIDIIINITSINISLCLNVRNWSAVVAHSHYPLNPQSNSLMYWLQCCFDFIFSITNSKVTIIIRTTRIIIILFVAFGRWFWMVIHPQPTTVSRARGRPRWSTQGTFRGAESSRAVITSSAVGTYMSHNSSSPRGEVEENNQKEVQHWRKEVEVNLVPPKLCIGCLGWSVVSNMETLASIFQHQMTIYFIIAYLNCVPGGGQWKPWQTD